jgi:RHS repeat-associated protein
MKWTLVNPAGTNDPDTGDIYSGLDRFGRVKDHRWLDGAGADLDRLQYGYDRVGNRLWRRNVVAAALGKEFDELYGYDGIHRLKHMARGTLNGGRTALTSETFAQCWTLDSTGNWQGFREDDDGNGTWDLVQQRSANAVNEISNISETTGPSWVTPAYSRAGNMTTMPQPADPTASYTATYDAWNRLVKLADGADTVSEYAYDGAKRRIVQKSYSGGALSETRHLYYTQPTQWQIIEERLGTSPDSADAERQFVWGRRYIDDLVLRDRDTDGNGTLERLYACQDANWNVTAIADDAGDVQERYAYSAYGVPVILNPVFIPQTEAFYWGLFFCGYRLDLTSGLFDVRNRGYLASLGEWMQRDPINNSEFGSNLYEYVVSRPTFAVDPFGNVPIVCHCSRVTSGTPMHGGGYTEYFDVETDCPGMGDDCCSSACNDGGGASTGPGNWNIINSGPDEPGPSLCGGAPYTAMTGMDCFACCIEQFGVPLTVVAPTIVAGGRIPKGIWEPGQAATKSVWTSMCTRYSTSSTLTKTVRIGSRVAVWMIIIEGGIDCCVMAKCANDCL